MSYFTSKKKILGIHLDFSALALVEIDAQKTSRKEGESYARSFCSTGSDDSVIEIELQRLISENNINSKTAYVSIPSISSIKKICHLSAEFTEKDIEAELYYEREKYLPGVGEEIVLDFMLTDEIDESSNLRKVYVFAAKKIEITRRTALLQKVGIKIISIEPDDYALLRILTHYQKITATTWRAEILVIITRAEVKIIVFNNNEILFSQILEIVAEELLLSAFKQFLYNFSLNYKEYQLTKVHLIEGSEKFAADFVRHFIDLFNAHKIPVVKLAVLGKYFKHEDNNIKVMTALGLALRGVKC